MLYEKIIRPQFFSWSSDDAEKAHELLEYIARAVQKNPALLSAIAWWYQAKKNPSPLNVRGFIFPNRIGLAAGFDKRGTMLPLLQALGFGFVTVGTVVPKPQPGNPRPRIFRMPQEELLINRLGFNSEGAKKVLARLETVQPSVRIPVGISLGKNKDTPNAEAAADYGYVYRESYTIGELPRGLCKLPQHPGASRFADQRKSRGYSRASAEYPQKVPSSAQAAVR